MPMEHDITSHFVEKAIMDFGSSWGGKSFGEATYWNYMLAITSIRGWDLNYSSSFLGLVHSPSGIPGREIGK